MTAESKKPVQGDRRILDPNEFGLLGQVLKVKAVDPLEEAVGSLGVNKDPNQFLLGPITQGEAGGTKLQRLILTSRKLNAHNQYNPSIITLAIESTVTKVGVSLDDSYPKETILQGVLKFGSGMANQGMQNGTPLDFLAGLKLDPRIIFDIGQGTQLSFPTAYFQLDLLYTSVGNEQGSGFAADLPVGPDYQVVYSLGYEPVAASHKTVTMTQFPTAIDIGAGDSVAFFRPKFGKGVYFQSSPWTPSVDDPTSVETFEVAFYNAFGNISWTVTYQMNNPPIVLPWPADSVACLVSAPEGTPLPWFRCVSILEL